MKSITKRMIESANFGNILTAALIQRIDVAVMVAPRADAGRVFMQRFSKLPKEQKDICFNIVADTDFDKLKNREYQNFFIKYSKHYVDFPIIACMNEAEFAAFILRRRAKRRVSECAREIVPDTNMLAYRNQVSPFLNKYITLKHVVEFVNSVLSLNEKERVPYFATIQSLLIQTIHTDVADYISRNQAIPLDLRINILSNYDSAHKKTQHWMISKQLDLRRAMARNGRNTALLRCVRRLLKFGYTLAEPVTVAGGKSCS